MLYKSVEQFLKSVSNDEQTKAKLSSTIEKQSEYFRSIYGENCDFIVVAPGRVNIIGDHIDYHGFSVFPMALSKRIWLSFAKRKIFEPSFRSVNCNGIVQLANTDSKRYPSWWGKHGPIYEDLASIDHWQKYFLCAYNEIVKSTAKLEAIREYSVKVLVHSELPPGCGLSSSSALVCASAAVMNIFTCASWEDESRVSMAKDCSEFERYVGTQGGGMDQAIIMTAQRDYAKYIQFMPDLKCKNVLLPQQVVWLVSNSGVECHKAATLGFNTRVLETRIGANLIALYHDIEVDQNLTLGRVKELLFQNWNTEKIVKHLTGEIFNNMNQDEPKTSWMQKILIELSIEEAEFVKRFKVDSKLQKYLNDQMTNLAIPDRCQHVFEEADRVAKFKSICGNQYADITQLGQLMNESHRSLRDKYECSHPALDKIVHTAMEAGALGSRLTGAGWGGCVITMVEKDKAPNVMEKLKEVSVYTFETEPASGLQVIVI